MKSTLLAALPRGRDHATSIPALAADLDIPEREVRQLIAELVTVDHVGVVTLPCHNGVWLAETPEELDIARAHLRSKLVTLRERMDALDRVAADMRWSPTLFEVAP